MTRRVIAETAAGTASISPSVSLRIPRVVAFSCALVGVLDILWLLMPRWHGSLSALTGWLPFDLTGAAGVAVALSGLLLLYLAHGLARGKHMAWMVAVVMVGLSVGGRILAGRGLLVAIPSIAVLGLLILGRHHFRAA